MNERLQYNIQLPENIENILSQDFFVFNNLSALFLGGLDEPIKFSANTNIYVRKGECEIEIDLIRYTIKAPCIINIKENQVLQKIRMTGDFDASFIVLSKRLINNMFMLVGSSEAISVVNRIPVLHLEERETEEMNELYLKLNQLASDKTGKYAYQALLHTLAAFFYHKGANYYERVQQDTISSQGRISDSFISLVQHYFRTERFLEFYAEKLMITPKHLSRTVKAQTGYSAVEWIERYVILEAKVMLRSSNMTIQQIGASLNFPTQSFFGKYFKKCVGVTPKDFRNMSYSEIESLQAKIRK